MLLARLETPALVSGFNEFAVMGILSKGGSVDAGELYQRFRGRLPGVEALLKGRGLIAAE